MKTFIPNLFTFALFWIFFFSISVSAQKCFDEFPSSLSANEIISKLKAQNMMPNDKSELAVIGEVQAARIFEYRPKMTLYEALSIAGGPKLFADDNVRVIRNDIKFGYVIEFSVSTKTIVTGKVDPSLNAGDIIIVSKIKKSQPHK